MARGSRRGIPPGPEMDEVLDAMRECHAAMVRVQTKSKIGGPSYKKAVAISDALHDMAEELTGDRNKLLK